MLSIPINIDDWIDQQLAPRRPPGYIRGPYQHHKDNLGSLEPVFRMLLDHPQVTGFMERLSAKTAIHRSTLSSWRLNLLRDREWRPKRCHYSLARRVLNDEQETQLAELIAAEYIDQGYLYTDADFKVDALRYFQQIVFGIQPGERELTDEEMAKVDKFTASPTFIAAFRHRNRLSLRRPSFKRRPTATQEQMDAFVEKVRGLITKYRGDQIINIDETNWKAVPGAFMTWAHTNSESVQCRIDNDEKEGVTVIAAVDSTGKKLPLTVIGKGKTERCLAGYHLPPEVRTCTSESGWTTTDVMCAYFAMLRRELFPHGPLVVILDTYSAHRAQVVREVAQLWGIELVFIPPGCTDKLQPLDRRIFGVLKVYARQLWREQYHESHGKKTTREQMAINLCEAWRRITEGTIQAAWDIYYEEDWMDALADDEASEEQEMLDGIGFAESLFQTRGH